LELLSRRVNLNESYRFGMFLNKIQWNSTEKTGKCGELSSVELQDWYQSMWWWMPTFSLLFYWVKAYQCDILPQCLSYHNLSINPSTFARIYDSATS